MVHSDVVETPIFVSFPPVRLVMTPRSITSLNGMIHSNSDIFIEIQFLIVILLHALLLLLPSSSCSSLSKARFGCYFIPGSDLVSSSLFWDDRHHSSFDVRLKLIFKLTNLIPCSKSFATPVMRVHIHWLCLNLCPKFVSFSCLADVIRATESLYPSQHKNHTDKAVANRSLAYFSSETTQ
jgi:hypothetical protein